MLRRHSQIGWGIYHCVFCGHEITVAKNSILPPATPVENTIVYKDTDGSLLKTVTKKWNNINQLAGECETLPMDRLQASSTSTKPTIQQAGLQDFLRVRPPI